MLLLLDTNERRRCVPVLQRSSHFRRDYRDLAHGATRRVFSRDMAHKPWLLGTRVFREGLHPICSYPRFRERDHLLLVVHTRRWRMVFSSPATQAGNGASASALRWSALSSCCCRDGRAPPFSARSFYPENGFWHGALCLSRQGVTTSRASTVVALLREPRDHALSAMRASFARLVSIIPSVVRTGRPCWPPAYVGTWA